VHPYRLALNLQFHAAVTHFRDLPEFIDREEIPDPIAETLRDVATVLAECLRRRG
jgi:hypothetical protein